MTDNLILIYILIFLISALVILLVALIFLYIRVLSKYTRVLSVDSEADLEKAHLKAKTLIEDAIRKSTEIVNSATVFKGEADKNLKDALKRSEENYAKEFSQAVKELELSISNKLAELPQHIAGISSAEVNKIGNAMQMSVNNSLTEFQNELNRLLVTTKGEIEKYKQTKFKEFEEKIFEIVELVSRDVLAKQISHDEHEKLVMKALDNIKKQNDLFSEEAEAKNS